MYYVVHSGGGELYGLFDTPEAAAAWAEANEEEVGDFDVQAVAVVTS